MSEVHMPEWELTDSPADGDISAIGSALAAFNHIDVGPSERRGLALLLRGDDGTVIGGLYGYTGWGWLYVQYLFVPERLRGRGLAGRMLAAAEQEAKERGCHGAWIDTFNPEALRIYQRQGFQIFGSLAEFPAGRSRHFLQKRFDLV